MAEEIEVDSITRGINTQTKLLVVAWLAIIATSNLAVIIWQELIQQEVPIWYPWIHVTILLVLMLFSQLDVEIRSLRPFIGILLLILILGFGGGWNFGLVKCIQASSLWLDWESSVPFSVSQPVFHAIRLIPALGVLLLLLVFGNKRRDMFLVKGEIAAPVEPSRLIGMKKDNTDRWTKIGPMFASIFFSFTLVFLVLGYQPTLEKFLVALPAIPAALLIAGMNAFNEEFTLRAAPLSVTHDTLGKHQALLLTSFYFGMGHFYGVPPGVMGIALAGFLGWFIGKSILETRGFFWAWFIHFLPDIVIFIFFAMFP